MTGRSEPVIRLIPPHRWVSTTRCATNAKGDVDVDGDLPERCCARDGGRPSAAALQGEAANRRQLRRDNARGGERDGKGPTLIGSGTDREGERKRTTVDVSKACQTTSKPRLRVGCGMNLGWSLLTAQVASGMEVARARSWLSWGTWEPAPGYSGGPK